MMQEQENDPKLTRLVIGCVAENAKISCSGFAIGSVNTMVRGAGRITFWPKQPRDLHFSASVDDPIPRPNYARVVAARSRFRLAAQ